MLKTLEKKKGREMLAEARGKIVALVNVITIANIYGGKTIDNKYSTHTHVKTLSRDLNKIINAFAPKLQ